MANKPKGGKAPREGKTPKKAMKKASRASGPSGKGSISTPPKGGPGR